EESSNEGQINGVVMVFHDITDRRKMERTLQESDARKEAILEGALDSIITIDHTGNVVNCNTAAEKTFGYSRQQFLGRPIVELLIPPRLRQRHIEGLNHYLATGHGPILDRRIEMPAMRADGSEFPCELTVTRVRVEGTPMFTAHLRDISERKRQEEAIKR